jgi:hypothetical protein
LKSGGQRLQTAKFSGVDGVTSTKKAPHPESYAQKKFGAVQKSVLAPAGRYQTHRFRKCLIYKVSLNCLFSRQFKQGLDLQGFPALFHKLSTKLSTGMLDNFKPCKKPAHCGRAGAVFQAFPAARPLERAL